MNAVDRLPHEAERNPIVFVKDGAVFATSRDVAEFFGKEHRNVLRDIDNLVAAEPNLGLLNFVQTPFVEPTTGQTYRLFEMSRDGFTLLAMGFTGQKALKWKLRYIEAFNTMEAHLRAQPVDPMALLRDPAALRGLLLDYSERVQSLEAERVTLVAAKNEADGALDRISNKEGTLCIRDTAKTLQIGEKALFSYLRNNGWIYRRPGAGHDLAYQTKLVAGFLVHKETSVFRPDGTEKFATQVRVTAKGLTTLSRLLSPMLQLVGGSAA